MKAKSEDSLPATRHSL